MTFVLDASVFFCDFEPAGPAFVPQAVVDELRDATSRLRFERLPRRAGMPACSRRPISISSLSHGISLP